MFHTIGAILVFIVGLIFLWTSYYAIKNNSNRLILNFSMMTFAMALFSIGYSWELFSKTLNSAYLAIKFQYLGLSFLSIYWLVFAYKFKSNKYPSVLQIVFISIVPILTFFTVMTNDVHRLFFTNIKLVPCYDSKFLVITTKGFLYYIFISYSYLILMYMLISFYHSYKFNKYNLKEQSKLMLIASIVPSFFNIIYLVGITPKNYDPTPFGFLIMCHFVYKAVFDYKFLDLKDTIRGSVFDKISEGILVLDIEYRIVDFNSSANLLLPYLVDEHRGNYIKEYQLGEKIVEKSQGDFFEINCLECPKQKILEFRKNPIYVKDKLVAYIYIFSDKTVLKERISNLSFLATHDFLTGLHNKMSFLKLADSELYRVKRYGGEMSLVMIDIDFFKKINDTYGHICGDEILRALTILIRKNLRATDIFARYGGEEFCVLLPETSLDNAEKFSENIRKIVEENIFYFNKTDIKLTISLGVTYYNKEMENISFEELLDMSDKALYKSKKSGRNKVSTLCLNPTE